MPKRITTKQFRELSTFDKQTLLFNLHLGFRQAWLNFGLDFPRKYWLTGAYSESDHDRKYRCIDRYRVNGYSLGVVSTEPKHAYVSCGMFFGGGTEVPYIDDLLPLKDDTLLDYDSAIEAGHNLFNTWVKAIGYTKLVPSGLKEVVEYAVITCNARENEILHFLAETKCLSRQQFIRTWNELKRDYKAEQYQLRGYHGQEAQEQAKKNPTLWAEEGVTPKQMQPTFNALLANIQWFR